MPQSIRGLFLSLHIYHYSLLKVIGAADCSSTVAKVLAGNIMESAFQGKVLADILVETYFRIEIGWSIGWSGSKIGRAHV